MSKSTTAPQFREKLPSNCPPEASSPLKKQIVLRLVGPGDVTEDDFKSHAALGYPCPKGNECEWAACSLFLNGIGRDKLRSLVKFPRLKKKNALAFLEINETAGVGVISKTKHISFWMFHNFKPLGNVKEVKPLDAYGT